MNEASLDSGDAAIAMERDRVKEVPQHRNLISWAYVMSETQT